MGVLPTTAAPTAESVNDNDLLSDDDDNDDGDINARQVPEGPTLVVEEVALAPVEEPHAHSIRDSETVQSNRGGADGGAGASNAVTTGAAEHGEGSGKDDGAATSAPGIGGEPGGEGGCVSIGRRMTKDMFFECSSEVRCVNALWMPLKDRCLLFLHHTL